MYGTVVWAVPIYGTVGWAVPMNRTVGWTVPMYGTVGWAVPIYGTVGWAHFLRSNFKVLRGNNFKIVVENIPYKYVKNSLYFRSEKFPNKKV